MTIKPVTLAIRTKVDRDEVDDVLRNLNDRDGFTVLEINDPFVPIEVGYVNDWQEARAQVESTLARITDWQRLFTVEDPRHPDPS